MSWSSCITVLEVVPLGKQGISHCPPVFMVMEIVLLVKQGISRRLIYAGQRAGPNWLTFLGNSWIGVTIIVFFYFTDIAGHFS